MKHGLDAPGRRIDRAPAESASQAFNRVSSTENAMFSWKRRHQLATVFALVGSVALAGCAEIYTRDDFTAKVTGKSMEDVRSAVGKPLKVDEGKAGAVTWTYEGRTIDIENKNSRDNRAILVFTTPADGQPRVSEVRFE
jgi:hypothetical protein